MPTKRAPPCVTYKHALARKHEFDGTSSPNAFGAAMSASSRRARRSRRGLEVNPNDEQAKAWLANLKALAAKRTAAAEAADAVEAAA